MDLEISHMQMDQCIKAIGQMVKNMDKEHSILKMDYIEKGNGSMAKEQNGLLHTKLPEQKANTKFISCFSFIIFNFQLYIYASYQVTQLSTWYFTISQILLQNTPSQKLDLVAARIFGISFGGNLRNGMKAIKKLDSGQNRARQYSVPVWNPAQWFPFMTQ